MTRRLFALLLASAAAVGCDHPFEPYTENTVGPFSMVGYLDLRADTQWVRVMPIRQKLVADPGPIDAIVTLEHLGTGRVVNLRDSLFAFTDPVLGVPAYAHNFWTTEPLEPNAMYRLEAVRSDGASTRATVEMPSRLDLVLHYDRSVETGPREPSRVSIRGDNLLYVDLIYTIWDSVVARGGDDIIVRQHPLRPIVPGDWQFGVPADSLERVGIKDMRRLEMRVAVAHSEWPFEPGLSPVDVVLPDALPTNVEDGVGFVGALALSTIPLPRCYPLEPRSDGGQDCATPFDESSATVAGRVRMAGCISGRRLPTVRLAQRFADGGVVVYEWLADWEGAFRFEGLEPGAGLRLEVDFGDDRVVPLPVPTLAPGERHVVPEIGCD